jgi:hypothetical protein
MNPISLLPPGYAWLVAFIVLGQSVYMVAWFTQLSRGAARTADPSDPALPRTALRVGAFLGAWLAAALVFANDPRCQRADNAWQGALSGILTMAFLLPAFLWAFLSRRGRRLAEAVEPASFVLVQSYRIEGLLFLFPLLAFGALPAEFAIPAGLGDALTGALAPLVAWSLAKRRPGARKLALLWNAFGILDLIVAPAAAIHSKTPILQMYPLSLVPLFLGPPIGILTHLLSIRSLSTHRESLLSGWLPIRRSGNLPA